MKNEIINNKFNLSFDKYYIKREAKDINYEESYWERATDPDGNEREMSSLAEREHKRKLAKKELEFINSLPSGIILDVGCGNGSILEGVDSRWEKHGVEISKYGANKASEFCNIFNGTLIEAKYPDSNFDVVFLFHVLEHMLDPINELIEIRRVLKTNGYLILGTPDFDSGCARRYGSNYRMLNDKTHTSLFTNESLDRLLSDYGFNTLYTDYPFFETEYFTSENLLKLLNKQNLSPPFYGNIITKYAQKMSLEDVNIKHKYLQELLFKLK